MLKAFFKHVLNMSIIFFLPFPVCCLGLIVSIQKLITRQAILVWQRLPTFFFQPPHYFGMSRLFPIPRVVTKGVQLVQSVPGDALERTDMLEKGLTDRPLQCSEEQACVSLGWRTLIHKCHDHMWASDCLPVARLEGTILNVRWSRVHIRPFHWTEGQCTCVKVVHAQDMVVTCWPLHQMMWTLVASLPM